LRPFSRRASKSYAQGSPGSQVSDPLTDSLTPSNGPIEGSNKSNGALRKCWSASPKTLIVNFSTI
jgi:hypothetical protein